MDCPLPTDDALRDQIPNLETFDLIDEGGYKAVYRASIVGNTEALKVIALPPSGRSHTGDAIREEVAGRVKREIEALRRADAPELVKLGSVRPISIRSGDAEFIAYSEEFLDGSDLWRLIEARGDLPPEAELRTLFVSLLRAIKELWRHGYVHRDIKPKNVMKLDDPARPFVLLDLGIAYSIREAALTYRPDERIVATYRYLAPELADPDYKQNINYRADLYTTGLTVFEYGAHAHPLARDSDDKIRTISRALHQQPKPFADARPDLSEALCGIVDQMLKKKPALRPANLDRLIAQLEEQP